jgi:hypothetical protein
VTMTYRGEGQHPGAWVTEGYPAPLLAVLKQVGGIPHEVRPVILSELGRRSPAALRERIERRWYLRFSNLTGPQIAERADEIAVALVEPGDCREPQCEDGWLLDDSGSCPRCRPGRSRFDARPEDLQPDSAATPEYGSRTAMALRDEVRRTRGVLRGGQSRHIVKKHTPYTPAPFTMREPEPDMPTIEQVERAQRAERSRQTQRAAETRAKAEKAARARNQGGKL